MIGALNEVHFDGAGLLVSCLEDGGADLDALERFHQEVVAHMAPIVERRAGLERD